MPRVICTNTTVAMTETGEHNVNPAKLSTKLGTARVEFENAETRTVVVLENLCFPTNLVSRDATAQIVLPRNFLSIQYLSRLLAYPFVPS